MLVLAVTNAHVCCPDFMAYCILACNILFSWFTISCNQKCSVTFKMHEIRFSLKLRPGPRWGSSRRSPRPLSRLGRGIPPPHSLPPRRLRRLVLCACGASPWVRGGSLLQGLRGIDAPASRDTTLTSQCVVSTSLLVLNGAVSCYPVSMVNLIWFANKKCLSYQLWATSEHENRGLVIQKLNILASVVC